MLKDNTLTPTEFFVTGGTVDKESISYVTRPADEELLDQIRAGHYCYVLTPRQMGKSSLRVRTSQSLQQKGVNTVILDLQRIIGAKSIKTLDELFHNLIYLIQHQLNLSVTAETWWQVHSALSPVQRFITYFHDVVLAEVQSQVVIFIDEIDILLNYDFRDDLFAALRAMYNARTDDPAFKRLIFVLLGVAAPADLIKNPRISPFNIGQGIDLQEFSLKDAIVLQNGLENFHPGQGQTIFSHIYHWTSGHPFLTQTVCLVAASMENGSWTEGQIDELVRQKILSAEANAETGSLGVVQKQIQEHLQFVQNQILGHPRQRHLLKLYKRIYQGQAVKDDKQFILHNHLKLSGLVTAKEGRLQVRNEIYRQVFNLAWIKENLPVYMEYLEQIIGVTVALILLLSGIWIWQVTEQQQPVEVLAQTYTDNFNTTTNPVLRLGALANLLGLEGYSDEARTLFDSLSLDDKIALFSGDMTGLQPQIRTVVKGTYTHFDDTQDNNRLLQAMQTALGQSDEADSKILAIEIGHWLDGRAAQAAGNYEEARQAYDNAIDTNKANPATHFERATVLVALEDYQSALTDFEAALSLDEGRREQVRPAVMSNRQLYDTWWDNRDKYPALAALVPTPTSTPTSTNTPTATDTPNIPPTPTFIPPATNSPTLTPTYTPTPTDTPTPIQPPTSTPTNSAVPNTLTPQITGKLAVPIDNKAASYDVVIYELPTGKELGRIPKARQPDFSPDGIKLIVNGHGGRGESEYLWEYNGDSTGGRAIIDSSDDEHPFYHPEYPVRQDIVVNNYNIENNWHAFIRYDFYNQTRKPVEFSADWCGTGKSCFYRHPVSDPDTPLFPLWGSDRYIIFRGCNEWNRGTWWVDDKGCGIWKTARGVVPTVRIIITDTSAIPTDTKGNNLVYMSRATGNWDVYVTSINGGESINITKNSEAEDGLGTISPDAQWVAFVSDRDKSWSIWVSPISGGTASRLPISIPVWHPALGGWTHERISWGP